jgi:hypothetical protein
MKASVYENKYSQTFCQMIALSPGWFRIKPGKEVSGFKPHQSAMPQGRIAFLFSTDYRLFHQLASILPQSSKGGIKTSPFADGSLAVHGTAERDRDGTSNVQPIGMKFESNV